MSNSLIGCLIKFDRALTHLESLRDSTQRFREAQSHSVPGKFDPETGQYLFRIEASSIPNREWSGLIGDALHNFRASLDYLAWELVDSYSPGQGTSRTEFPIFQERHEFERRSRSKTKGMSPEAIKIVERLQPFNDPPAKRHPSDNPLWLLQSLGNIDKHRTLTVTAEALALQWQGLPPDVEAVDPNFVREEYTSATVAFTPGDRAERWMNVELAVTSDVCFPQRGPAAGRPVIGTLWSIALQIRETVIPQLRPFVS